jgi:hypothetical protein
VRGIINKRGRNYSGREGSGFRVRERDAVARIRSPPAPIVRAGLVLSYFKSLLTTKYAKGAKGGMLSYCLKTKVKGGQEDLGVSPPLEKGAGGI